MTNLVTGGNLSADDFSVGGVVANQITVLVDGVTVNRGAGGLSAVAPTLAYDSLTATLTYTPPGGAAQTIDLSALTTDIFVNGGTFDAATSVLTLTDSDGTTPDVTIDLSALLGVSVDAGNLLNPGTDGKPLFTKANLDAETGICTDVFGVNLFRGVNI